LFLYSLSGGCRLLFGGWVDVRVAVEGGDALAELESLRDWLIGVEDLRGRVTGVQAPPPPGALGPVLEVIEVALGPGGAATAFAAALISWIRQRSGAVKVRVERPGGGCVQFDAEHVRSLAGPELRVQLEAMLHVMRQDGDVTDESDEAGLR
jgi:Effector Associated Constant Component 1